MILCDYLKIMEINQSEIDELNENYIDFISEILFSLNKVTSSLLNDNFENTITKDNISILLKMSLNRAVAMYDLIFLSKNLLSDESQNLINKTIGNFCKAQKIQPLICQYMKLSDSDCNKKSLSNEIKILNDQTLSQEEQNDIINKMKSPNSVINYIESIFFFTLIVFSNYIIVEYMVDPMAFVRSYLILIEETNDIVDTKNILFESHNEEYIKSFYEMLLFDNTEPMIDLAKTQNFENMNDWDLLMLQSYINLKYEIYFMNPTMVYFLTIFYEIKKFDPDFDQALVNFCKNFLKNKCVTNDNEQLILLFCKSEYWGNERISNNIKNNIKNLERLYENKMISYQELRNQNKQLLDQNIQLISQNKQLVNKNKILQEKNDQQYDVIEKRDATINKLTDELKNYCTSYDKLKTELQECNEIKQRDIIIADLKNKLSDNQKWWIEKLREQNYKALVCYGWTEASKVI